MRDTKIPFIKRLIGDKSGNAVLFTALGMPVLIGAAGYALDMAQMYAWKRELQQSVDQAAMAGAWALAYDEDTTTWQTRAQQEYDAYLKLMAAHDLPEETAKQALAQTSAEASHVDGFCDTDLSGMKVLVVDDELDARSLIQRLLLDCKADVITAASVAEALEIIVGETPDVIVSDIGMPGEDGYGLIRRVRALQKGKSQIPAIALTGYARTEDRVKAINAGFQLHLSKLVELVELVAMVNSLVKRPPTGP